LGRRPHHRQPAARHVAQGHRGLPRRGREGTIAPTIHLCYAEDDDTALAIAYEQWRTNCLPTIVAWDLETPEQFEAATRYVPPEAVAQSVHISADAGRHVGWLGEYLALGFDDLYLHHVGQDEDAFINAFGAKVVPQLTGSRP
jgi:alkanesulfonate monooxygenase SsuD/methylene tetrahydromethanopterin reductase-like flavin-dependent oxidoreductase (luciferase family)